MTLFKVYIIEVLKSYSNRTDQKNIFPEVLNYQLKLILAILAIFTIFAIFGGFTFRLQTLGPCSKFQILVMGTVLTTFKNIKFD